MKITPLQLLLLTKVQPIARVRQATGRSRTAVWRWAAGKTVPRPAEARKLVALYAGQLDYNGCYAPSVELTEERALALGVAEARA